MASKGQTFNSYSYELKMEIVKKYLDNKAGYSSLSKEYNVPYKTIVNWIYKYKNLNEDLKDKKHLRGRKREDNIDYKERYEILKKYQAFLKAQREKK